MTKIEKRNMAKDLIMEQIARIGYGDDYEDFKAKIGDDKEALTILKEQMDRVAKLMGYKAAWFG